MVELVETIMTEDGERQRRADIATSGVVELVETTPEGPPNRQTIL